MNNYLSHVNLLNMLNNIACSNLMVILDVCYGGTLSVGTQTQQNTDACRNALQQGLSITGLSPKDSKKVLQNLNCSNRFFLTSGGNEYVPDGTPGAHSPFSAALLACLENCNKVMVASELTAQVRDQLRDHNASAPLPASGKFGVNGNQTEYVWFMPQY